MESRARTSICIFGGSVRSWSCIVTGVYARRCSCRSSTQAHKHTSTKHANTQASVSGRNDQVKTIKVNDSSDDEPSGALGFEAPGVWGP